MSVQTPQNNLYPIVLKTDSKPVGTICYLQTGVFGTPLGLLLSVTLTPLFKKVIATSNGFQTII